MKWLAGWIALAVVASCSSNKLLQQRQQNSFKQAEMAVHRIPGQNRIVFMTLAVSLKDSLKDEYGFAQQSLQYAAGTVKETSIFTGQYEPYQLYWQISNATGKLLASGHVPDPLFRSYETSDEHSGSMERHLLKGTSGEIVIRFNLNDNTKVLSISKLSNGKLKQLYEAKLL